MMGNKEDGTLMMRKSELTSYRPIVQKTHTYSLNSTVLRAKTNLVMSGSKALEGA